MWDPGNNSSSADTTPSSEEASLPRQIPGALRRLEFSHDL